MRRFAILVCIRFVDKEGALLSKNCCDEPSRPQRQVHAATASVEEVIQPGRMTANDNLGGKPVPLSRRYQVQCSVYHDRRYRVDPRLQRGEEAMMAIAHD